MYYATYIINNIRYILKYKSNPTIGTTIGTTFLFNRRSKTDTQSHIYLLLYLNENKLFRL